MWKTRPMRLLPRRKQNAHEGAGDHWRASRVVRHGPELDHQRLTLGIVRIGFALGADNVLTTTQNRLVQLWAINVIT